VRKLGLEFQTQFLMSLDRITYRRLSSPSERHFSLFSGKFWRAYPFALPCFVGAGFAISAVIVGSIFLKEVRNLVIFSWNYFYFYIDVI
jgi:hypothetical protein